MSEYDIGFMSQKSKLTNEEIIRKYKVPIDVIDRLIDEVGAEMDEQIDDMDLSDMESAAIFYRNRIGEKLLAEFVERKDIKVKKNVKK
ncbi:MAG: hypothetical protein OEV78_12895 [Spirochaetia bacterium]|nr:hypothetical protein [Spirochaetia bacterium]